MPRRKKPPPRLERRGDGWRAKFQLDGARHSITVPVTDRRAALAAVERRVRELEQEAERRAAGAATGIRMSVLLAQFEREELPVLVPGARMAYEDSLKPIRQFFVTEIGDPLVETIKARHIKDYLSWRRVHRLVGGTEPLSNRTLQKDRAVLHRLFVIADKHEYREGNPVARVDRPKADGRDPIILTGDQYEALLMACDDRPMVRLYVLILAEAGLRCKSEAQWLMWDDINFGDGAIRVTSGRGGHRTKSGKSRYVPMTPRLASALRQHFARYRFAQYNGIPTPWVLHHEITRCHHTAGARIGSLHSGFQSAAARAKLPAGLHQHDLRHKRVTDWLAAGKSPVAVMHAMGHSDIKTTMSYYRFVPDHLRALVTEEPQARVTPGERARDAANA